MRLAHDAHQQAPAVPQNAGRRAAHLAVPHHPAGRRLDGDQPVGALQADEHLAGIRRVVDVAGQASRRNPVQQLQRGRVVDVDLCARQAGHGQITAVRAVL